MGYDRDYYLATGTTPKGLMHEVATKLGENTNIDAAYRWRVHGGISVVKFGSDNEFFSQALVYYRTNT